TPHLTASMSRSMTGWASSPAPPDSATGVLRRRATGTSSGRTASIASRSAKAALWLRVDVARVRSRGSDEEKGSAGHKLGQMVGDWFEQFFVLPLLKQVAKDLKLYLDSRFQDRAARGEKLVWRDENGNDVDYDFVMEMEGTKTQLGIPVALLE